MTFLARRQALDTDPIPVYRHKHHVDTRCNNKVHSSELHKFRE